MTLPILCSRNKHFAAGAAAALSIAVIAGCSSDEPDATDTASPATTAESATDASPAFEGVDPCSLIPAEKAAEAAGVPVISVERSPQDRPEVIGCDWGGFGEGTASLAFMIDGDLGMDYEVIGNAGGKDIELMSGTPGNCTVQVKYSEGRTMLVSAVPTAAAKADDQGNPNLKWCGVVSDLAKVADSNLDWE